MCIIYLEIISCNVSYKIKIEWILSIHMNNPVYIHIICYNNKCVNFFTIVIQVIYSLHHVLLPGWFYITLYTWSLINHVYLHHK